MPELPEVESTVQRIRPQLVGKYIQQVWVGWPRTIAIPSLQKFRRRLPGSKIIEVSRRGKFITAELHKDFSGKQPAPSTYYLLCHLRMSGRLFVDGSGSRVQKHSRLRLTLDDDSVLEFHDVRKFGRFYLVDDLETITGSLGPEPLDKKFNRYDFFHQLQKRKARLKPLLLNQSFLAGLGNIYADEALWRAQLHPLREANSLTLSESGELLRAIRHVLRRALSSHGTDFGDGVIRGGSFRPAVYGREAQKCRRCRAAIEKIWVGQRGTHFCPACQPDPR